MTKIMALLLWGCILIVCPLGDLLRGSYNSLRRWQRRWLIYIKVNNPRTKGLGQLDVQSLQLFEPLTFTNNMMRCKLKHFEELDMLYILKGYRALSTCDLTFGYASYSYANALVLCFHFVLLLSRSVSFTNILNLHVLLNFASTTIVSTSFHLWCLEVAWAHLL
jgi:hypothetical protein